VKSYIKEKIIKYSVKIPPDFDTKKVNLIKAYSTCENSPKIVELKRIAKERGGTCLSHYYINSKIKYLFKCSKGHTWMSLPNHIRNGSWCAKCARVKKLTIEEMQKLAHSRGGKCLSDSYITGRMNLLWECSEAHTWEATPENVKRGTWCTKCSGREKLTIEEMQKLAHSRRGKCLSEKYINNKSKLLWECSEGHTWEAAPSSIKSGRWCKKCYLNNRRINKKIITMI